MIVIELKVVSLSLNFRREQDGYIKPDNFKKGNFPSLDGVWRVDPIASIKGF